MEHSTLAFLFGLAAAQALGWNYFVDAESRVRSIHPDHAFPTDTSSQWRKVFRKLSFFQLQYQGEITLFPLIENFSLRHRMQSIPAIPPVWQLHTVSHVIAFSYFINRCTLGWKYNHSRTDGFVDHLNDWYVTPVDCLR